MKNGTRLFARSAVLLMAFGISPAAFAVNYACSGPVNGVTVGPGGTVSAESAGGQHWGYFCQLGATANGINPDACKGILAVLLAAQAQGKQVNLWYNDDYSCAWHAANGSWAYLTTWYWGPTLLD
jgi:hypothetical protein